MKLLIMHFSLVIIFLFSFLTIQNTEIHSVGRA
jgi:hypothetical protein